VSPLPSSAFGWSETGILVFCGGLRLSFVPGLFFLFQAMLWLVREGRNSKLDRVEKRYWFVIRDKIGDEVIGLILPDVPPGCLGPVRGVGGLTD